MARDFGAAVLGYIVMFAVVFVLFSGMWAVLGADGAFQPGTFEISWAWIGLMIPLSVVVAMAGGYTASKVGETGGKAVPILVVLVIIVTILQNFPEPEASSIIRPEGITMFDAMSQVRQPTWLLVLNPILGVVGVLIGARIERGSREGA